MKSAAVSAEKPRTATRKARRAGVQRDRPSNLRSEITKTLRARRSQRQHEVRQREFLFPQQSHLSALEPGEISVDLFAGGGGASEAIEQATGQPVSIAVNHDEWAIAMHAANHPFTLHVQDDVWKAHPLKLVAGRLVGWFHASPDCTHFSQARGGQPRKKATRALSWCVIKWAGMLAKCGLAPRCISLENVNQIRFWGPLVAKRCEETGRVIKLDDGTVAAPGERIPVWNQCLVPDKRHEGRTWKQFVRALRALGYVVEWRRIVAADFGAGTTRERLFLIARRDGKPIVWPTPTHGPGRTHPYITAADCINWDKPGRSIFHRQRPLARNTVARTLDGARRGNWPQPYIDALTALRDGRTPNLDITIEQAAEIQAMLRPTAGAGGVQSLVMGTPGGATARPVDGPMSTITTGGAGNADRPGCARHQLFEPIVTPYYGSGSGKTGQPVSAKPLPVVTTKSRFSIAVPVVISTCNSSSRGVRLANEPLRTVTTAKGGDLAIAMPVVIGYRIDILYRMLDASELFAAQGFPKDYIIDRTADGREIVVHRAIRMVGNSVSPPPLIALIRANLMRAPNVEARAA
jgi:DNA (cytosine-5)-methyltransferase 1